MNTPKIIADALDAGAHLSLSVSGGKDSQAMAQACHLMTPDRSMVHSDLGRAEWPQTAAYVDAMAERYACELTIVRRTKGDLVDRIADRLAQVSTLTGEPPAKPFWPSAAQRYCTSDLKRDPIAKHHRSLGKDRLIVSCVGMRAEESPARAKREPVSVDKRITSKCYRDLTPAAALDAWRASGGKGRLVLTWLPIHDWTQDQVWSAIADGRDDLERRRDLYRAGREAEALEGWTCHPAYVFGNERLSCALCVLASESDLRNGMRHHPELYAQYVAWEQQTGFTFQQGKALSDLAKTEGLPIVNQPQAGCEGCPATF